MDVVEHGVPLRVDKTEQGKIVECAKMGQDGYVDNIEYNLCIVYSNGRAFITYYGEDDTWLSYEEIEQALLL